MSTLRKLALTLCAVSALSGVAWAQDTEGDAFWMAYFDNGKAADLGWNGDDRLLTWFDAHARFLDDAGGFNQSIIRPGVGWKTGEDTALWYGYAWIRTSPIAGDDFDENRMWQQWTWTPKIGRFDCQVRSRFEQRWLETGDDVGLRWRQFTRASTPLIDSCPRITAVVWDEVFWHLNDTDWGAEAGLNQNRLFVGFGCQRCKSSPCRVEIGYLNQAINTPGDDNRVNHILSVNFFR